ncbi:DNA/RNA non-specific endonuclease [Dubosiella newyorkensis]|uniref:DNA/RNA non-specific endonuclease n=1 Tax=Dubosiella newyorkensis TaxID=1862672 RepID=UPI00248BE43F|nr:DNA/RNA non-specific endonuclease [Dubosiella newyorkensis]
MKKWLQLFLSFWLVFGFTACQAQIKPSVSLDTLPDYSNVPYIAIDDNIPSFNEDEITTTSFETYYLLDSLGRATGAFASLGKDLLPTKERADIHQVKPSGWQSVRYDQVEGGSLYNRCHLIAWSLSGEDANPNNLITGTRYLNTKGMLPFENMVRDYIKETGNHVMYRVIPIYDDSNLVAKGVEMEALSVEDQGEGISFHVYCFNVQPGIQIDYANGDSWEDGSNPTRSDRSKEQTFVLNTKTKKIHSPDCSSVKSMNTKNKKFVRDSLENLEQEGYSVHAQCIKENKK